MFLERKHTSIMRTYGMRTSGCEHPDVGADHRGGAQRLLQCSHRDARIMEACSHCGKQMMPARDPEQMTPVCDPKQ